MEESVMIPVPCQCEECREREVKKLIRGLALSGVALGVFTTLLIIWLFAWKTGEVRFFVEEVTG